MDSQVLAADSLKIGNTDQPSMWDGFQFGRPGLYHTYFDDFDQLPVAADWTLTDVGATTRTIATAAPCVGGVLKVALANADNNLSSMQRLGNTFTPTAGSTIYFECRFQSDEATQMDHLVGLVLTDTDPLTSTTGGLYFRKDDGDLLIDFETNAGGVISTDSGIGTFAANTYFKVGFKVTGTSQVEYWVNDVKKGTFTTNIPTVPLRVTLHAQDGDTGAALGALSAFYDYVFVAQTRV